MRLPTSKLRRCRPPPPPQPLQHFVCHYISSSTSHSSCSLFSRPIHYPHHHKGHGSFNTGWSSELRSLSPRDFVSFARRFSIEPKLSELDDPIPSVQTIISMLDSYHDVTGFPWWIIISPSTTAMRLPLFPLVVLQLKKLKRIGDLLPKLPPPFPPPLSGRSFRDQIALFVKEKKAPSVFWFFSSFIVQAFGLEFLVVSFVFGCKVWGLFFGGDRAIRFVGLSFFFGFFPSRTFQNVDSAIQRRDIPES